MRGLRTVAVLLATGCSSGPRLAPLPEPDTGSFLEPVREAINAARENAVANPRNPDAAGAYGMVLHAHDQFESAARAYERARALDRNRFEWHYYAGMTYAAAGNYDAAIAALRRACETRPDYAPARIRLADALLDAGDVQASRHEYSEVLSAQSDAPVALFGLGTALAAAGEHARAADAFERATRLFPNYGAAHYSAAQAYRKVGNESRAEAHARMYERSRKLAPPIDDPIYERVRALNVGAQAHVQRSMDLDAVGRLQEAAAANRRALEIDPRLVQAHINLISLYGRMGRFEDAKRQYEDATAIQPRAADAHYNYGVAMASAGRLAEALAAFRRAVEADPKHADAHNNYGYFLEQHGKIDAALRHYKSAIELMPGHRLAHYHLGRLLIGRGRAQEAVGHFEQIIEPIDDKSAEFTYGLATAYVRAGDLASARSATKRAYELAMEYKQTELANRIGHDLRVLEARLKR